ncbi:MAG: hypothetical protein KC964_28660 [Candidatus Omnitrophica bacterium]|nr:hypothetical protein [Candidatus Omnitrophota bacterium]
MKRRYENSYESFIWNENNTAFDAGLGFFNRPNLDVSFENWEYQTQVHTNSWGLRDDEPSLLDPEIILIGDSFGFGWGVEDDETAAAILEERIQKRVLNLSVACYGTVQEFLLLQRFCEVHDATGCTLVFLYYINDRIENRAPPGEALPTVRKQGGRLVFTSANRETYDQIMQIYKRSIITDLSWHSSVLDLFVGTFINPRSGREEAGNFDWDRWESKKELYPGIPIETFEVFEYTLRVLNLYSRERQFEVKFVLLPFLELYEEVDDPRDYEQEKKVLRMVQIPYLDLTSQFSREDFYQYDRHLTPKGQEKLGVAIAKFLEDEKNP